MQEQLQKILSSPGVGSLDINTVLTFWRPRMANPGRKSSVLDLTDRQLDAMYALAGAEGGEGTLTSN